MRFKLNLDFIGIGASLACAIHCALMPLLLTSLPLFGINIIDNEAFEYGMIFLAFLIGAVSLFHGYKKHHHSFRPMIYFSIGIVLLLAKQSFHEYQYYILPAAIFFIISGHLMNHKACRVHDHGHSDDCNH